MLMGSFRADLVEGNGVRVVMQFRDADGAEKTSIAMANAGIGSGIASVHARIADLSPTILLSSNVPGRRKMAEYFGELERTKRLDEIVPALRILEPRLSSLRQIPLAGELVVHGDIGFDELVPLTVMGDGLQRALCILLAIANAPWSVACW